MKLNIGGGLKRFDGFLNVDADPLTKPDYLVNLETEKWSLPSSPTSNGKSGSSQ